MLSRVRRVAVLVCLTAAGLLLGVVGAFLHALRVSVLGVGVPALVPVLLAALLVLGVTGAAVAGAGSRLGAALPTGAWLATTLYFSVRRPEGDLVVTGTLVSVVYLLLGTVIAGVTVGLPPDVLRAGLRARQADVEAALDTEPVAGTPRGTADEPPRTRR